MPTSRARARMGLAEASSSQLSAIRDAKASYDSVTLLSIVRVCRKRLVPQAYEVPCSRACTPAVASRSTYWRLPPWYAAYHTLALRPQPASTVAPAQEQLPVLLQDRPRAGCRDSFRRYCKHVECGGPLSTSRCVRTCSEMNSVGTCRAGAMPIALCAINRGTEQTS